MAYEGQWRDGKQLGHSMQTHHRQLGTKHHKFFPTHLLSPAEAAVCPTEFRAYAAWSASSSALTDVSEDVLFEDWRSLFDLHAGGWAGIGTEVGEMFGDKQALPLIVETS